MSIDDNFSGVTTGGRPVPTTLSAIRAPGADTINCDSLTGWDNDAPIHFMIYRVDVNGKKIIGSQTDWKGIVVDNTITQLELTAGSDEGDVIGAIVQAGPTAAWAQELYEGLVLDHDGKGHHKTLTDENNNEWLGRGTVPNAVNFPKISHSAAGKPTRIDASGDDADVDFYFGGKGAGVAHFENPELMPADIVVSGGLIVSTSGLTASISDIVCYIGGKRVKRKTIDNKTFTATKDTHVDIGLDGVLIFQEVGVGASAPALAPNTIRIGVVTSTSNSLAIKQDGATFGILIRNQNPQPLHFNSLFYTTGGGGGGQVIPALAETPFRPDVADPNGFGILPFLDSGSGFPKLVVSRAGMYSIDFTAAMSDGSATQSFIVWIEISVDNGSTFYRLRQTDRNLANGQSQLYSEKVWLPAGAQVRISVYSGGQQIRFAGQDNSFAGRYYTGPKLTVVEQR